MTTRTSDVLIIGGGILGASLAYHLARKGVPNVMLLEKGTPGDGSTGKSAAIVRMHYTNAATVQLALRSRELFLLDALSAAGAIRISLAHHNTPEEVDRFLDEMTDVLGS